MRRLTEQSYWESVFQSRKEAGTPGLRAFVKRLLGPRWIEALRGYSEYLLWQVIYPQHLPPQPGLKVIEIGSAPGYHLLQLHQRFGYDPYGVEYAESGVARNRELFAANGLDPAQVIHADFFASDFHQRYRGFFDLVMSRGFIEHFDHPQDVVKRHADLLKAGGYLVVSIPNKRGVNRPLAAFFNRRSLAMHNLDIMRLAAFRQLFDLASLRTLYCGYYGVFSFSQFNTPAGSPLRYLLAACRFIQFGLNILFRLLFPRGGPESAWFSPYLLYIGIVEER